MNVKDFISETLSQIHSGVQSAAGLEGLEISPRPLIGNDNAAAGHMVSVDGRRPIVMIEFDLSVTVQSKIEGEAGGGLTVLGIGGKGEISTGIDHTRIQRIKFQIPVTVRARKQETAA